MYKTKNAIIGLCGRGGLAILVGGWLALVGAASAAPLKIVTTTSDLAALAEAVAGDHAQIDAICDGTRDPHFLQAKPSYIIQARDADLWVCVGLELEVGWAPAVVNASRNPRIRPGTTGYLDASTGIARLEVPQQRVSRVMGDVHAAGNPHYWLDPLNGRIMAATLAARLRQLDPAHAADYTRNLEAFKLALDSRMFGTELCSHSGGEQLWALLLKGQLVEYLRDTPELPPLGGWLGAMRPWAGRRIITHHRSWVYFAHRFGLDVVAELEPKPGVPPSASHLAGVIELARQVDARLLLVEPFYGRKAADKVAARIGGRVVVQRNSAVAGQMPNGYLQMFDRIIAELAAAFAAVPQTGD